MMTREQAEVALQKWELEQRRQDSQRNPLVQDAYMAGVNKHRIHVLTGLARTTIDDILKIYSEDGDYGDTPESADGMTGQETDRLLSELARENYRQYQEDQR